MKLSDIGKQAKKIEDEIGISIDDILNKLTQELGEFNDSVQKLRGRYSRKKCTIDDVKEEVGDILFNLVSVCNRLGIDPDELPEFAENTLKSFIERKETYKDNKGE